MDKVIITENQMKHILERHPDSFEDAIQSLESMATLPDYVFKDRNKNSTLLIEKPPGSDEYVQIVPRLCTSEKEPDFKNSIVSCWKIGHKGLQNYLRSKTYLYKKEQPRYNRGINDSKRLSEVMNFVVTTHPLGQKKCRRDDACQIISQKST